MRFNRPIIIESEEPTKLSNAWSLIIRNKNLLAWLILFIIFLQFNGGIQSAIAASLLLFGLIILSDLFENIEGEYKQKEFHIDPYMGMMVIGGLTFLITWIACAAHYGFLFGFGLGWIPAYILSQILMCMWRIISLVVISVLFAVTLWAT